jgi:hypothetical protein
MLIIQIISTRRRCFLFASLSASDRCPLAYMATFKQVDALKANYMRARNLHAANAPLGQRLVWMSPCDQVKRTLSECKHLAGAAGT